MSSEFDQQNLVSIFVAEAQDGMAVLTSALHPADESVPAAQQLQEHYIVAHRIRGAAALYGYSGIARLSERLETLFERALEISDSDWPRAVGAMREIVQGIESHIQCISQGRREDASVQERCLAASEGFLADGPSEPAPAEALSQDYVIPVLDAEVLSYFVPEAEEYLDTIDTLAGTLRVNAGDDDASHRLFRTAHTLKGSAFTVGFQVIGDIAHPMEDCMVAVRESRVPLSAALCDVMTRATAIIRLLLRRDPAHAERLKRDIPVILRLLKQLSEGASVAVPEKLETINQSEGTATVPSPTPAASPYRPEREKHLPIWRTTTSFLTWTPRSCLTLLRKLKNISRHWRPIS